MGVLRATGLALVATVRWPFFLFVGANALGYIASVSPDDQYAALGNAAELAQVSALALTAVSSAFCFATGRRKLAMTNLALFFVYGVATFLMVLAAGLQANFSRPYDDRPKAPPAQGIDGGR